MERADYDHPFFEEAYKNYQKGEYEAAFVKYLIASELGYDIAHINVAWMLENHQYQLGQSYNDSLAEALIYYQRAANLGNTEARVKVGDFYYDGKGAREDRKLAVLHYQNAADGQGGSPIAWFNLGYMHQEGIGVNKVYFFFYH